MIGRLAAIAGIESAGLFVIQAQTAPGLSWELILGQGGALVVMGVAIWWLANQLKIRDAALEKMNQESRDMAKAALDALRKVG